MKILVTLLLGAMLFVSSILIAQSEIIVSRERVKDFKNWID